MLSTLVKPSLLLLQVLPLPQHPQQFQHPPPPPPKKTQNSQSKAPKHLFLIYILNFIADVNNLQRIARLLLPLKQMTATVHQTTYSLFHLNFTQSYLQQAAQSCAGTSPVPLLMPAHCFATNKFFFFTGIGWFKCYFFNTALIATGKKKKKAEKFNSLTI